MKSTQQLTLMTRDARPARAAWIIGTFAAQAGEGVRELAKVFTRMPNHARRSAAEADKAKKNVMGRVSATTCQGLVEAASKEQ